MTGSKLKSSHAPVGQLAQLTPRERILAAARELFYLSGINSVGVEAIVDAAATNKMTLYRNFGSKDDLIVAYVRDLAAEGDDIWRSFERVSSDPAKRIEAWLDHVEDILTDRYQRGCALANAAVELPANHSARKVIEAYKKRKRERLVALFSEAGVKDAARLADEVFLLFEGARISMQCGGKGPAMRTARLLRDLIASAPRLRRRTSRPA